MASPTRGGGLVVVISGPSGAGKTTLCRRLVERYGYEFSVSVTTRPPRSGEVNGRDYFFVTPEEFGSMVSRGELLEHSEHFGHRYGTPRSPVERAIGEGRVILLDIDVNGAAQVRKQLPGAVCIFVSAPSDAENERRLRGRHSEDESAIRQRLLRAEMEKAMQVEYDYRVVNDDLEQTVARLHDIIQSEAMRRHGRGTT